MWLANSQEDFYEMIDMQPLQTSAWIITARIKLRNDHGPTEQLSDPQEFVLIDGLYYPLRWIKSGQGLRREQLEVQS